MSQVLDDIVHADLDNQRPVTTTAVLDGAVIIQMLRSRSMLTIGDYFTDYFVSCILFRFKRNVLNQELINEEAVKHEGQLHL